MSPTPPKIDIHREHPDEYTAQSEPAIVTIGPGRYLTVSGRGAPAGTEFQQKVAALYGMAYTIKFATKRTSGRDLKVSAMEGLWSDIPGTRPRSSWRWKMLLRVSEFVTPEDLTAARNELKKKHRTGPESDSRRWKKASPSKRSMSARTRPSLRRWPG